MATQADLRSRLRRAVSDIDPTDYEFEDPILNGVLDDALARHKSTITYSSLPKDEEYPVLLLAWRNVCLVRAGNHTQFFSISSEEGSGDKSQVMQNNITLARELLEEYQDSSHGDTIQVATLLTRERFREVLLPDVAVPLPPVLTLATPTGATTTTLSLSWDKPSITDFNRYVVFRHTSAGLKDLTRLTSTDTDENKDFGIAAAATKVKEIYDRDLVNYKVTGLTSGTTYYFVIVLVNNNGKISHSNEVSGATS